MSGKKGNNYIILQEQGIAKIELNRRKGKNLWAIIDLEDLEKALNENPKPKFMYLIPNFQNPTGLTMSLEMRQKILGLAKKYEVLILEDNPYGDLKEMIFLL